MHYITALTATTLTFTTLLQLCPAPPLAAIGIGAAEAASVVGGVGGGAVAGGIGYAASKQKAKKPPRSAEGQDALAGLNLPEEAADDCREELRSATVNVSPADNNGVRFDGVPPACMTLANVFLGQNTLGQPVPIPMGSASLQYENLSPDELQTLQNALDAKMNQRRHAVAFKG